MMTMGVTGCYFEVQCATGRDGEQGMKGGTGGLREGERRALGGMGRGAGGIHGAPLTLSSPSTGSPSPRSSPSSSPSLRKRLLLPPRTSPELPADAMVEKSTESVPERGPLSAPLNYPLSARSFIRNNKKAQSWYSMLSPTYKQRNEDFRRIFKGLPESERLLVDYSCALQRDILLQGRLYLSENWLCFYSNIFRWETALPISPRDPKPCTSPHCPGLCQLPLPPHPLQVPLNPAPPLLPWATAPLPSVSLSSALPHLPWAASSFPSP
uniref:GRAM domain containing 1A n=1 Tax=Chrysemys picta bellii TaxID=8478 RepID=A0A8C3FI01_CHRPI